MRKTILLLFTACISFMGNTAELVMTDGWARASIPGAANGAAYLSLKNTGDDAVTLVGMSSEVAKVTELHTHIHADGMMKMQQVAKKSIAAGESLKMQPGGYHVMLMGLKQPLQANESIQIVLNFADGTQQSIDVGIRNP